MGYLVQVVDGPRRILVNRPITLKDARRVALEAIGIVEPPEDSGIRIHVTVYCPPYGDGPSEVHSEEVWYHVRDRLDGFGLAIDGPGLDDLQPNCAPGKVQGASGSTAKQSAGAGDGVVAPTEGAASGSST